MSTRYCIRVLRTRPDTRSCVVLCWWQLKGNYQSLSLDQLAGNLMENYQNDRSNRTDPWYHTLGWHLKRSLTEISNSIVFNEFSHANHCLASNGDCSCSIWSAHWWHIRQCTWNGYNIRIGVCPANWSIPTRSDIFDYWSKCLGRRDRSSSQWYSGWSPWSSRREQSLWYRHRLRKGHRWMNAREFECPRRRWIAEFRAHSLDSSPILDHIAVYQRITKQLRMHSWFSA